MESFMQIYYNVAYKLSLPDILNQISDYDKFCTCLTKENVIYTAESDQVKKSEQKSRKNCLFKILLCKNDNWQSSGVLPAIYNTDKAASDYAVVAVLEAFNDVLNKVLEQRKPLTVSIWPKLDETSHRPCPDTELDDHMKKLAYVLSLPALLTNVDLDKFCRLLFKGGVITQSELDGFFPTDRQQLTCFLVEKEPKAVLAALPTEALQNLANEMNTRAYAYVLNIVLDPLPKPQTVARYAWMGLAAVGVGITAVVAAPVALAAAGFGAGGIAAGSFAAWFMSTYGGAVSAGSLCALLQSAGAAGIATSTSFGIGAASSGASFGLLSGITSLIKKFKRKNERKKFDSH